MKLFFERIFSRWTAWEIHETNLPQIEETFASPILGSYLISRRHVIVDVYVKTNKFNGLKKYKKVIKK